MTLIRRIYLYLFSFIGLILVIIGCVQLVNLGLKAYIFKAADQYYSYPVPTPVSADGNMKGTTTSVPTTPTDAQLQAYQDEQTNSNRESTAANAIAMIIVGVPLYYYHWRVIQKDKEKNA